MAAEGKTGAISCCDIWLHLKGRRNGAVFAVFQNILSYSSKSNQFSIILVTDSKFVSFSGKLCAELRPELW
jgi:hypothetical protein